MFTVTLLTSPKKPALEPVLLDNLRGAWGGDTVFWLSPGEVAEFSVAARPDNLSDVWHDLQVMEIDLVVQPAEGRRKMLLLADMDSTLIQQECIDELADAAGVGNQVANITARAMNGEIDFVGALRERVALLKGVKTSVIGTVLANRITLMPGGLLCF